jgi:hypothetical protein
MDDHRQIENLINRSMYLADKGDWQGYADLARHLTIKFKRKGVEYNMTGTDEIMRERQIYLDSLPKELETIHKHVVSNYIIEVADDRLTATSQCYLTAYRRVGGEPMRLVSHTMYHDRLRKIDGEWWVTEREVELVWSVESQD